MDNNIIIEMIENKDHNTYGKFPYKLVVGNQHLTYLTEYTSLSILGSTIEHVWVAQDSGYFHLGQEKRPRIHFICEPILQPETHYVGHDVEIMAWHPPHWYPSKRGTTESNPYVSFLFEDNEVLPFPSIAWQQQDNEAGSTLESVGMLFDISYDDKPLRCKFVFKKG